MIIRTPPQEVLDLIKKRYLYDPNTGIVSAKGKKIGSLHKRRGRTSYLRFNIVLDVHTDDLGIRTQRFYTALLHQIIWYLVYDNWPDKLIDHIDGDGTNNKLNNLRLATSEQNGHNQRKQSRKTSSQYKGVSFDTWSGRWQSYIQHKNKNIHIGRHDTEEEAARAYDAKARELFGEFANCNFPLPE
jgi:hypothetical protein